jgi:hypothetical protein
MEDQLDGINEKLKRADESIQNLNSEIVAFFDGCDYPVIPKGDTQEILKALRYHRELRIPPRFSVLAGEVVHHLRSSLDYIVWALSSSTYRREHRTSIEFPIFKARPIDKKELASYERKVKGISSLDARRIINDLQPYNPTNSLGPRLAMLHRMNIIDKHRELMMFAVTGRTEFPMQLAERRAQQKGIDLDNLTIGDFSKEELEQYGNSTPQIAFRDFGGGKVQTVIPVLTQLKDAVVDVVGLFESELGKC